MIFREFGASSLNFRCYGHVGEVNLRFQVQSDLHMRITEVFRAKGIEISHLGHSREGALWRIAPIRTHSTATPPGVEGREPVLVIEP
mgnify:CR=1 FL=1